MLSMVANGGAVVQYYLSMTINRSTELLYEVVLYGSYFGQQIVNRWNYISTGSPGTVSGSFGLAAAMGFIPTGNPAEYPSGTIFDALRELQVIAMTHVSATVRAVADYDPADFYEVSFGSGVSGKQQGQGQAPFVALGFRSNRVRTDIARGTKRFPGVPEELTDPGGVITNAIYLLQMRQLASLMDDTLTFTEDNQTLTYAPCIVGKNKVALPNGNVTYRYYPTLQQQEQHLAVSVTWQPYTTLRTQTSRQYGRGS